MKNTLYFDSSFARELLENEENAENSIFVVITTDASTNQTLEIVSGSTSSSQALTSSAVNTYELTSDLWNLGGTVTLRLVNDDYTSEYVTLTFPDALETDSALYETEAGTAYEMQGSYNVVETLQTLEGIVSQVVLKILDYVTPTYVSTDAIADGENNDVMIFSFSCQNAVEKMPMFATIGITAETTVDTSTNTYDDLTVTISYTLDDTLIGEATKTFGDGDQLLTLDFLMENITAGDHILVVNLACSGGAIS